MRFRCLLRRAMLLVLLVPSLLAGCGDLPEPFLGNPGATARRLAIPATPMLAVPPPAGALLTAPASADFADLLALNLQREEIPTLARVPRKTDWRLAISAERRGEQVVPRYAVQDPSGRELGAIDGAPVAATGWTSGTPEILGQAAKDALPKVLALMTSIRATRDRADPNSLLNRIARLYVPEVTGARGDGNPTLTRLIRTRLAEFGPLVQVTPENTDFTVTGQVVMSALPNGKQQVEIVWTVTRPSGVVTGKVSQLNSVAAGTLDQFWGDVAIVVAQEAASGINSVVERFIGREPALAKGEAPTGGAVVLPAIAAPSGHSPPAGSIATTPSSLASTVPSGPGSAAPSGPGASRSAGPGAITLSAPGSAAPSGNNVKSPPGLGAKASPATQGGVAVGTTVTTSSAVTTPPAAQTGGGPGVATATPAERSRTGMAAAGTVANGKAVQGPTTSRPAAPDTGKAAATGGQKPGAAAKPLPAKKALPAAKTEPVSGSRDAGVPTVR